MTSRGAAAGQDDPLVAIEGHFEAERRFVDEWLLQLRDCGQELDAELAVPGAASVRPEDWAPCQARACDCLHQRPIKPAYTVVLLLLSNTESCLLLKEEL